MSNLRRFFHYHDGEYHWKGVKIMASVVMAASLFVLSGSLQAFSVFQETGYVLSMLVPEPIVPALAEEVSAEETPTMTAGETASPAPSPEPAPATAETSPSGDSEPNGTPSDDAGEESSNSEEQEQFERERLLRERKDRLREMKDQKRELARICKQLKNLKGAAADASACAAILVSVTADEQKLSGLSSDIEALEEFLAQYREKDVWEEMNVLRYKANVPRELNDFFRSLTRLEKLFKQKQFQKIPGLNYEVITAKVAEIKSLHAQAKACYTDGDFECANEKLNEARETNFPGDLEGPLHILRGVFESLKRIKDPAVKTEVEALVQPSIDLINQGEWRDGSQELNAMNKELMQMLSNLARSQGRSRTLSPEARNRLEKLLQKYGGTRPDADNGAEDHP